MSVASEKHQVGRTPMEGQCVPETERRLAYFSAQAVVEGQDTWAAVHEVVSRVRQHGWAVDVYCPEYAAGTSPTVIERLRRILGVQWRLARVLRSYDALYVRAHPLAWPIAMQAKRWGVPVVQESNGSWDDAFAAWPFLKSVAPAVIAMQRAQYRRADALIAVSETLAAWLLKVAGRADIVVSPNGANDELFRPDAPRLPGLPPRYAVFFGQFAPWQGIDTLLAAVDTPEWPRDIDLVIAGDGVMRPAVEAAAARDPRVHYLGVVPYREVPSLVANALAATVLTYAPERAGYSPLKLYEAMACGVPIVCSDTPGQAEFVREERAGIVVPPEDPVAVARAVATIAADPDAAQAMGRRGARAVKEKYSWAARVRQRLEVIEAAVERSRQADAR